MVIVFILYAIALSAALARRGYRSQAAPPGGGTRDHPARILIIGATGGTGRQLVAQALERGGAVTAFVRDPSRFQVEHPQLTVVQGDVRDYASVESAMRGHDAVLCALGHKRFFYPTRILSEGTRNILKAMDAHGVTRLVCETALGIGDGAGRFGLLYTLFVIPVVLPFYFWDKARQEQVIAASKIDYVIVRPALLTNGKKRGSYHHGPRVGSFLLTARISRADVAHFMLHQLTSDRYLRAAPGVCW